MSNMDQEIKDLASKLEPEIVACRRDLHKHPELGWTEFRTASIVIEKLRELGYELHFGDEVVKADEQMGVPSEEILEACQKRAVDEGADPELVARMAGGRTGVVGILDTKKPGKTVALRFDMDCLPLDEVQDEKHRPYREGFTSVHEHCMHACGHDGHTTAGLAVATILASLKDRLTGRVKLIFQPGEEGVRGARAMVAAGVVDDVDYFLASHIMMPRTGTLGYDVGGFMATTKFDIDYTGVSAHAGSDPEQGKNALLAAVNATENMQAISRHSGGETRINVGVLNAGTGRNVIPEFAHMEVETRGETTELNEYMFDRAKTIAEAAAAMFDVKMKLTLTGGAAAGNNTPELSQRAKSVAERLGTFDTYQSMTDMGGSEDCSYFMERVQKHGGQAAYLVIGGSQTAGNHNCYFDFDEHALVLDAGLLSALTCDLLSE